MRALFLLLIFLPSSLYAFWPLSWELGNEKRFLGPLISYSEEDEERQFVFRPFLASYDSDPGEDWAVNYLYPLGKVSPGRSYLVPVYMSNRSENASDAAFLLFFYGKTRDEGAYGGFFPVAGKLKKRFGRDEMGFFLWPIYSYTENDGATKTNYLWPFFARYSGEERGFKAWPLYGDRERPGVRRTQFFLWPVFLKQEKNLDTDNPITSRWAMPFYMESVSRLHETKGVLYPLFSYRRNEDKEEWTYLWPFISSSKGKENENITFFPFYQREKDGRDSKFYLLYPIYAEKEWYVKDERYHRSSVLLINRKIEEEGATFFNVWPYFEYQTTAAGDYDFIALSPLPLRYEGLTRIVKPLFTLYEQRKRDGRLMTSILYGLYTREEEGDDWKMRFAFLFGLSRERGQAGFEILSGLFGVSSDTIKIFYIPIKRD